MKINVKVDDHIYEVEIVDLNKRPIIARVDGEEFVVTPETNLSAPPRPNLSAPSLNPAEAENGSTIGDQTLVLSPLPGVVTEVFVLPGAQIDTGAPLLVIEAMKMKNTIRANRSGVIGKVHVQHGQTVTHKQALVEYSE